MDETNFVDNIRADFYIDNVDEADEAAHGDVSNTLSDESYGNMIAEYRPDQDNIFNVYYDKYIEAELMMDVPGEVTRS